MIKQTITNEFISSLTKLTETDIAIIFMTKQGEIVKLFRPEILGFFSMVGLDYEGKILNRENYNISHEIIKPNTAYYDKSGRFCGFKTRHANGIDYNTLDSNLTLLERTNLEKYNKLYRRLERIVKKNKDIVFPDLCTCDNIFVNGDNIELIDYDGMQIGKYKAASMSTSMHEEKYDYYVPKYWKRDLFTKNLDKKSLIILYFLTTFNVDLTKVGFINPFTKQPITLEEMFNLIGLEDYEMYDKVSKIFDDNVDNEYLGETVDKIAKDYNMTVYPESNNGIYLKKLIKK